MSSVLLLIAFLFFLLLIIWMAAVSILRKINVHRDYKTIGAHYGLNPRQLKEAQEALMFRGLDPNMANKIIIELCKEIRERRGGVVMFDELLQKRIELMGAHPRQANHRA